jgi:hypothetical protein
MSEAAFLGQFSDHSELEPQKERLLWLYRLTVAETLGDCLEALRGLLHHAEIGKTLFYMRSHASMHHPCLAPVFEHLEIAWQNMLVAEEMILELTLTHEDANTTVQQIRDQIDEATRAPFARRLAATDAP